jgi:hypothetical protein
VIKVDEHKTFVATQNQKLIQKGQLTNFKINFSKRFSALMLSLYKKSGKNKEGFSFTKIAYSILCFSKSLKS